MGATLPGPSPALRGCWDASPQQLKLSLHTGLPHCSLASALGEKSGVQDRIIDSKLFPPSTLKSSVYYVSSLDCWYEILCKKRKISVAPATPETFKILFLFHCFHIYSGVSRNSNVFIHLLSIRETFSVGLLQVIFISVNFLLLLLLLVPRIEFL